MNLTERIQKLIKEISKDIFEKEIIFKLSFLAMLSGESIFLLGKPGIAKSMVARRIKFALRDGKIFEYLMNRFSTPDEIFGSISIKSLQQGKYFRITEQYLPSANIAFLDEIWKSGPSILNNLLTILNEKIFRNDGVDQKVPLWLLISASNELPEKEKGLEALYDRFIIRYIAQPLTKKTNFDNMLSVNIEPDISIDESLQITDSEYNNWLNDIKNIKITSVTLEFINIFRKNLQKITDGNAYISDRRWTKIVRIMRASAYYNGRKIIDKSDWLIIPYCIWDTYEQENEYRKIFLNTFQDNIMLDIKMQKENINNKIQNLLTQIKEVENGVISIKEYDNIFENKIVGTFYRLNGLTENYKLCYIAKQDYIQLINTNDSINIKLYLSNNQSQVENIKNYILKFNSKGKLVILTKNLKTTKEFLYPEQNDYDPEVKLTELNAKLSELKYLYSKLIDKNKNEFMRIKNQSNIFLNDDLKIVVDNYQNNVKINKSIL